MQPECPLHAAVTPWGPESPLVCLNCLGTTTISFSRELGGKKSTKSIAAMIHRPILGSGNNGWRNKGLKKNSGKRNGRRWGCNRLDPEWGLKRGARLSKAASLSLVSKSGKCLSKDAVRKSRKDIYVQHQQLPSFSSSLKNHFSKPSIHLPD